ncbi:MAG: molybdopterin-dependent oxidoreductase [Deltaproteobacteria bacterium]|nr:MAG: molybdopterin-dependent oxidoreductase [Deltaproteobacteria bacterium]
MEEKITACFLCGCNCGMVMTLNENGKIVKIRGDKDNLETKGFICKKGVKQGEQHIDSPHRLTTPLKREGDRLVEVSWDEALDGIGREIKRIKKKYGARSLSLALGGSGHPTLQVMLAFQLLRAMGSRNLYSPVGLELSSKYLANQKIFGCSQMDGFPDYENSEYSILIGSNPVISFPTHGHALGKVSKDPNRTIVVIDPRYTETARLADLYSPIRPSTDIYFVLAILNILIKENLYDEKMVREHSTGIENVKMSVARFTPEAVSEVTGIESDFIQKVARGFGRAKRGVLLYDMGVVANHHSTLVSWATQTIMFITGNLGKKGGGLLYPTLMNFNYGEKMAFGGDVYTSRVRGYEEVCGFLPVTVLQDEILTPGPGQIRAMIVSGCNPLRAYTNSAKMERAFKELEFLVSIDIFLTEVGRLAHWVLPVCSFHEQENLSFGFHGLRSQPFIQLTQRIREPLGDSRPEWMIYRDLFKRSDAYWMGYRLVHYGFEIAEFIRKLRGKKGELDRQEAIIRFFARMGGTSYKELKENPHGLILKKRLSYNFLDDIRTPDKKAHLEVPEFLTAVDRLIIQPPVKDQNYPFILSTTCRTWANVNTIYRNEEWIEKHMPTNSLVMHPDDAAPLGINEGDRVMMSSRTGKAEAPVMFNRDVLRGTVYLSHGWGLTSRDPKDNSGELRGTPAALFLPDDEGDAFTGLPLFSGIPCRVERIGDS